MVRCLLADSGLLWFLWGEMMSTGVFLGDREAHSAISMQAPFKMLNGTEPDLRLLESSAPGSLCTSRRAPRSSNSRQWKDSWSGTATTAKATPSAIQPPGASWKAETSSSLRHSRTYSRHLQRKRHRSFFGRKWTVTTTSLTTPFCGTFATHFGDGPLSWRSNRSHHCGGLSTKP